MDLSQESVLHKKIIYTFTFGILWGIIEIILNSIFSYNNLYSKGIIFSVISVFILLFSKEFTGYKFSLLIVALIAVTIKSAAQGISVNYIIALFAQAFIAEIFFIFFNKKIASIVTGSLIVLYSFIHSLIFHGSLPGDYIIYFYNKLFEGFTGIKASENIYFVILIFFGTVNLVIGAVSGWLSYKVVDAYQKKIEDSIESFIMSE